MGICFGAPLDNRSPSTIRPSSPGQSKNNSKECGYNAGNGRNMAESGNMDERCPKGHILPTPNLKVFSFGDLKSATKNFEIVLGEGGFGRVFKGWVDDKTLAPSKNYSGMVVAVKKLDPESLQGFQEWQVILVLGFKMEKGQGSGSARQLFGNLCSYLRKFIFSVLAEGPIPNHIAFIMDGNRRYAKKQNLKEGEGYRAGFLSLISMLKYCYELGVKYITVYAFSIDNFNRGPESVQCVMDLMQEKIEWLLQEDSNILNRYGVRLYFIGNLKLLSEPLRVVAEKAMVATASNTRAVLLICVAYTSTNEMVHAVQDYCEHKRDKHIRELDAIREEEVQVQPIKLVDLEKHMYMSVAPDPDILVRTSGGKRLSNFLLWQTTYCHLYSPAVLWPDVGLWHLVIFLIALVRADTSDTPTIMFTSADRVDNHSGEEDIDIVATYSDASGDVQISTVKFKDLSASWVWDRNIDLPKSVQTIEDSFQLGISGSEDNNKLNEHQSVEGGIQYQQMTPMDPVKLQRRKLRQERKELRTAELVLQDKETENQMQAAAIERSKELNTTIKGKYSIWRREYINPNSDSTLKLMLDQIIMAKAYGSIARSKNKLGLYDSLMKHVKESQHAIGEAGSDAELRPRALERAKAMGRVLSNAKDQLYDCLVVARKLRAMLQSNEESISALKKQSAFLIQLAAKTVPKPLHCLPLQLTTDYFLLDRGNEEVLNIDKLEDSSLYHYAIFSDNVLATAVVVNSTVLHTKEPEKHVFHIVTDRLNIAAMKMWFLVNPPVSASIQVENIDDFKWLNSSYCSVLRQLESARMKEYYFNTNHPSTLSDSSDNLKYRNPKYLSMLNHLRFYLPEVYPKLEKILFLDDDIVVQKDLTPLWSIDLEGMVNGAVETCKESFHRFDKYLNFSNPKISQNFDPNACGWAFGMNMFDLKVWKKRDITGIYHHWQDMNEDRTLWKLGSLPPGLITFYNLTFALDRSWHVLGLGYDPALNQTEIENAAVIHYNGNYKPWLDLAVTKYRPYWSRYDRTGQDEAILLACAVHEADLKKEISML
ncbi:hypothetical protein HHK36_008801 [Tetracentron sinense]|uniref:Hexosyltransferase n=1 Tax=Tetracentron sinense TaxID=13715 RepID=A0A834ZG34_TETSI|nr:hypothetical protein HHK36_008801 [Tetracentron sinense]